MVFSDYMNNLRNERLEMIELLAKKTQTSKNTVYRWISGEITPPKIKRSIISEVLKLPVSDLFPEK